MHVSKISMTDGEPEVFLRMTYEEARRLRGLVGGIGGADTPDEPAGKHSVELIPLSPGLRHHLADPLWTALKEAGVESDFYRWKADNPF